MAKHTPTRMAAMAGVTVLALSACGGVKTSSGGGGEDYPTGAVEMPVGASAGGSSDLISRAISEGLKNELGGTFPVINRPGANGALAAAQIENAAPDGSTIAVQNASLFTITPLAVSENEVTEIDDFDVIQGISLDEYVMVTNPKSGFTSLEDLKGQDSTLTYGTTGVGTGAQLASALTFADMDIKASAVPFDGGAPNLTALLGNQVDVSTMQVGEAAENIRSGKLVPLAVFSEERLDFLPEVPTAIEEGYDVQVSQYRFLTAPKGLPEDITSAITEALSAVYQSEGYTKVNADNSLIPMEISGEEVIERIKADRQRYAELVEEQGISLTGGN